MTLCDLPIKTLLAFQRNQIYSEASSTHFSAVNLWYTSALPIIILIDPNKSQTFQKTIRVIAEHNWIWHCDLLIKTLLASQRNQIYSEASSTHFSAVNLWYTHALPIIILIDPNKSQTFQKTIRVIAEHNWIWHCDLLIKTLLASQRNQIYSEASSTHFSAVNLWYTHALPIIILIDPNKSQTFQKTIRVIAEHNWIWHCDLIIKTLLASQRNQIYSEASSTHFSVVNLWYTYALRIIILIDPNKSQTFQKTIRVIAEHNWIWHCDLLIKTLLASQRNQIYSEASSTHFSAVNLWYTHALPIIILIDPNKSQTFQKTIRVIAEHNWIWHCDLIIKTLLASQRNQIYSEASSTHFSVVNLWYTYALRIIILIDPNKSQTFQKTISVIAEHNSIWHFAIYQSKDFSPLNAIKYILKHLQHTFLLLIYHILRSTHHNPHCS